MAVPDGYLIFRDGVQIDIVTVQDVVSYTDLTALAGVTYSYQVAAANFNGTSWVQASALSDPLEATIPAEHSNHAIFGFNDERVYGGYLGGRLKGTTVACVAANANKVKPC